MTRKYQIDGRKIPQRYIPRYLTKRDREKQKTYLRKSRKMYKRGVYYERPKVKSYKHISSPHVRRAMAMYSVKNMKPTRELARRTKCKLSALRKIVNKGRGAYYSSGSRPNQTAESWGLARLGSAITGYNASIVDYDILEKGCEANSKVLVLAKRLRKSRKNN